MTVVLSILVKISRVSHSLACVLFDFLNLGLMDLFLVMEWIETESRCDNQLTDIDFKLMQLLDVALIFPDL